VFRFAAERRRAPQGNELPATIRDLIRRRSDDGDERLAWRGQSGFTFAMTLCYPL